MRNLLNARKNCFSGTKFPMLLINHNSNILASNNIFRIETGFAEEELLGMRLEQLIKKYVIFDKTLTNFIIEENYSFLLFNLELNCKEKGVKIKSAYIINYFDNSECIRESLIVFDPIIKAKDNQHFYKSFDYSYNYLNWN